ncbi:MULTISPECIES: fimbrial protein [Providencia]|mgnify:CR=1 FL=1|uniref:Fimbrial protein n=5 Tax=Providencia rustigianii TaxID=158850 RepID=D1P0T2_9GAMM|nr:MULTISPECIES: fimbrial protein [Providencia]EFB72951.1 fimbrial protein [Providencia rustigianii DSM 4541]MTC56400.1 fimbrial protein [Providencia rustigianii]MTC59566.1 fimbrial protein [Providencia rustigianii]SUC25335.1 S-fimbrial adhesin protein SfaS precursor [Providencia rustigianii]VEH53223.1 S-fimbrial adhesin protein SfaS precursor [Providencia rustigianii]
MKSIKFIFIISLFISYQAIAASTINLNFTGNIKAATCNISGGSNINIDLNKLPAGLFNAAKSGSSWTAFNISLNNCSTYINQVRLTFTGTADAADINSLYKNQGTATNIAIQLQNSSGTTPLGNNKVLLVPLNNQTTINIPLRTRAFSSVGNVVPGSISANITATITYL